MENHHIKHCLDGMPVQDGKTAEYIYISATMQESISFSYEPLTTKKLSDQQLQAEGDVMANFDAPVTVRCLRGWV